MKTRVLSLLFSVCLLSTACGKKSGFDAVEMPTEAAKLQDLESPDMDPADEPEESPDLPEDNEPERPRSSNSMLSIAKWVIEYEARKVGPACNFFIQRVLALMGYGRSSWRANDFDNYVRNHFRSYEQKTFTFDSDGSEKRRLRNYLWSMPEKTPFLIQWKRARGPGHIAIVHRNGDQLVIYHASLNRFVAKSQTINIDLLLYRSKISYSLNVFSDLKL